MQARIGTLRARRFNRKNQLGFTGDNEKLFAEQGPEKRQLAVQINEPGPTRIPPGETERQRPGLDQLDIESGHLQAFNYCFVGQRQLMIEEIEVVLVTIAEIWTKDQEATTRFQDRRHTLKDR